MKMNRFFALLIALVCVCAFCVPSFAEGTEDMTRFGLGDLFGFGSGTDSQSIGGLGSLFGITDDTGSYGSTGDLDLGSLFGGMFGDTGSYGTTDAYGSTGDYGLGDLFGMFGGTGSYDTTDAYGSTGDYGLGDLFGMFGGTGSTGDLELAEEEVITPTPQPTATPAPVIEEGELPKPELLTGTTVTVTVNGTKYKAHKAFRNYLDELSELISMSYDEFQGNIKNFEAALQAYEDYIALNSELLSWKNINAQEYQGDAAYYLQTVVTVLTTFISALQ